MPFKDRREAGRVLAERLLKYGEENPIVLALPRGGVPVGYEIASALGAPLDVVVARKLPAPNQPELAIGAIAPGGIQILNEEVVQSIGLSEEEIAEIAMNEETEMARRLRDFRGETALPDVWGRTVILVDDGLATGATARAAIRVLREQKPGRLIFASPVCARDAAGTLSSEVDNVVCVESPAHFGAVGLWYEDFEPTLDEEVVALLKRAREERAKAA